VLIPQPATQPKSTIPLPPSSHSAAASPGTLRTHTIYIYPSLPGGYCRHSGHCHAFMLQPLGPIQLYLALALRPHLSVCLPVLSHVLHLNHQPIYTGDRRVAQPKFIYLYIVLARNDCTQLEWVDECVGVTMQKLWKGKHRSHYLMSSLQWL